MMERTVHRWMTGVTLGKEVFTDFGLCGWCFFASRNVGSLIVLALTVIQEEASTFGLQINRSKTKILQVLFSTSSSTVQVAVGHVEVVDRRRICLSGMFRWLLWWQQRGRGPASDWLSSVLHEYVGEEDLEVKHQAGNQVTPLSDIHCASFDVWVRDLGHHKVPALSPQCIWHMGTTQDLEDTVYSPCVKCGSQKNHWLFTAFSPGD